MRQLLEEGPLLGFVDYDIFRDGEPSRDAVKIQRRKDYSYCAGVRGLSYCDAWQLSGGWDHFLSQCQKCNLSYIVPNAEAEVARLTAERRYLAKVCAIYAGEAREQYGDGRERPEFWEKAASKAVAAGEGKE